MNAERREPSDIAAALLRGVIDARGLEEPGVEHLERLARDLVRFIETVLVSVLELHGEHELH